VPIFAQLFQTLISIDSDLAKNWDIDIASELEEYLGELEAISFEIDGAAKPLNFAEGMLSLIYG
jgi:condensin-2 complex subunit H2